MQGGLQHLHSLGPVNGDLSRDLKPGNVMVEGGGVAVIIDLDSCWREGEAIGVKGPSPGWGDYTEYANVESDVRGPREQMERCFMG